MGDAEGDSGSENSEAPQVDWASLEGQLSAGALESLREHLQVTSMLTPELLCASCVLSKYYSGTIELHTPIGVHATRAPRHDHGGYGLQT